MFARTGVRCLQRLPTNAFIFPSVFLASLAFCIVLMLAARSLGWNFGWAAPVTLPFEPHWTGEDIQINRDSALTALNEISRLLEGHWTGQWANPALGSCTLTRLGHHDYGKKFLCNPELLLPGHCFFVSVGVQREYTFEKDMVDRFGCQGVMLDPSVTYPSEFWPGVTFLQWGVRLLPSDLPTLRPEGWMLVDIPLLMLSMGVDRIQVLKMDCEGCEYAIAQSVLAHDPRFFHKVDQFIVEVHAGKAFMKSEDHVIALGELFRLLKEAGMVLTHIDMTRCARHHEVPGCQPLLTATHYPCQPGRSNMCQELLFTRPSAPF